MRPTRFHSGNCRLGGGMAACGSRKSLADVATGRMSPYEATEIHKSLAEQAGMTLSKWYDTTDGKTALHGLVHLETNHVMTMNPLGDGYAVAKKKIKFEDNADNKHERADSTLPTSAQSDDDDDDSGVGPEDGHIPGEERARSMDKMIKRFMAEGKTFDQAATLAHRAECGR
jgi:hypothetical protein